MTAYEDWLSTPAGVFQRAAGVVPQPALAPAPLGVGAVCADDPAELEARRIQHEAFTRAWEPVLAEQRQLAARGWTGRFIDIPDTRPAPLKALDMAITAARSVTEVAGPGQHLSAERDARARWEAAQRRQDHHPGVAGAT